MLLRFVPLLLRLCENGRLIEQKGMDSHFEAGPLLGLLNYGSAHRVGLLHVAQGEASCLSSQACSAHQVMREGWSAALNTDEQEVGVSPLAKEWSCRPFLDGG